MATLIDSSLWVDYFRSKTPRAIKELAAGYIDSEEALLCEPVRFEILRAATKAERDQIESMFETMPLLPSPEHLWDQATELGQACVDIGLKPRPMDLLIAIVCNHHQVEIVTFDTHFVEIGKACPIEVNLLMRSR